MHGPELHPEPLSLPDRLIAAAQLWSAATERSLGALASMVVNHGSFFDRLQERDSTTTATLQKFARFLGDAANWPEGHGVPADVCAFAHVVGVSSAACAAATDTDPAVIGDCPAAPVSPAGLAEAGGELPLAPGGGLL